MENKLILYSKAEDLKRLNFIYNNIKEAIGEQGKVLDVGCGNGNISLFLGEKGYDVKGIDISPDAIEVAKKRNPYTNVSFEVRPAEQLRDNGERYKAIVCSEVLEHLDEPEKLVAVLHDILTDDGVLVVTVPNGYGPREVLMTKPMQAIYRRGGTMKKMMMNTKSSLGYSGTTVQSAAADLTHVQFFNRKALNELADKARFKIQKIQNANFVEAVFPYSFLTNRIMALQKLDCAVADALPVGFTSGFYTVWKKA
ncbi:methyltransferase domain-containing protein [bacterium]|nr:methyltransferase domain-containing protein [bacterium]